MAACAQRRVRRNALLKARHGSYGPDLCIRARSLIIHAAFLLPLFKTALNTTKLFASSGFEENEFSQLAGALEEESHVVQP